ncbi:MAG: hypothetical protein KKH52_00975 [Nanoarchaeota archaeon]|nr:hypothetical protein [Nanoarchaeota archaeon]MBU1622936.1 hypothetical protein [Nanoarchaeota archaeon]MBU1973949.1 hypothetical protein [Nanoarchaeota archaeon]
MISRVKKIIIYLDMLLLIMTASWIIFGVSKSVNNIELVYNYTYIITLTIALLLNIKVIHQKNE